MNSQRVWLAEMLNLALDLGLVAYEDLLGHVGTAQLGRVLPQEEIARLMGAGLEGGKFTPETMIRTLGVTTLVAHVSTDDLWTAIREGVARALEGEEEGAEETTRIEPVPEPVAVRPAPAAEGAKASRASAPPKAAPPKAAPPKAAPPKAAPPKAAPPKKRRSATLLGGTVAPVHPARRDATERTMPPEAGMDELDQVLDALDEDAIVGEKSV